MKNKFQRNMDGMTLGGGSIEHPLSIHSASIGTRWKPRGMQLICTLVLLFTFAIGQMWGADFTENIDQIRVLPTRSGLVKIKATNSDAVASSGKISIGSNKTGTFTIESNLPNEFKIKSVTFTLNRAPNTFTTSDGTLTGSNSNKTWTFAPTNNNPINSASFSLKSTSSSTTFTCSVTLTTATASVVEELSTFTLSGSAFAFNTSLVAPATTQVVITNKANAAASSNYINLSKSSNERSFTVSAKSGYRLKFISFYYYDIASDPAVNPSVNTYTASTYTWKPTTAATSVDFLFNAKDAGIKIWKIYVGYDATSFTLSATATPDGYGTLTASSISNIANGTAISTNNNVLTVGESSITANPTAQTAQYTYAFDSWKKSDDSALPSTVTADLAVKAIFTRSARNYIVTLHTNDGTINAGNVESYTFGVGAALPTNVTKPSNDFVGWFDNEGLTGTAVTNIAADATGNKEYWAKWQEEAQKHNITYAGYGDADMSAYPTQYSQGLGIASFAPLADTEDQHFLGWSPAFIATTATTDQTITATWEDKKVVTFNSNGGSAVADVKVVSGEAVAAPTAPTRLNWTFQKWQKGGEDYDFATAVTEDITLDAVWSRNEISGTPTDIVLVSTSAAIGSTSPLTGVYYGNAEWTYTGNAKISTGGAMFGTPNAKKWVGFTLPSGYTATVTANSTSSNDRYCVLVTEADRAGDAGSATKYLNIHVNESGKQTQTSSQIGAGSYALGSTSGGIDINSVVVHVSEAPIMVTFKTGEATYAAITATSGEKLGNLFLNGALPTPVIAGYAFNGWKNGENDATVNDEITASMTITADMTPVTYNLTLSAGNGALTAGAAKIQIGASAMTDITTTTGTGVLVGYFTTADGDVKVAESNGTLVAGDVEGFVANGKWNRASDAELFAQYLASYDVKFYPGYGENAQIGSTQEVLENGKAVAPADPEREGYEFLGWSTDGTAANIQAVASYAITVATDFTAVWKQKFTVTYYDGATKLGEETVLAGESPVEAGNYDDKVLSTFAGWYNNSNLAEEHKIINVAELVINDNTSIYGKWNKDYATSVNLKAEAASTEDPKPTYEEVLAAHNISGALTNTSWDTGTDIYNGLKIKGKDSYITFNLKQGQFVVMTVGYANNDVEIRVDNVAQSFTASTTELTYFRYYAESDDVFIKVTKTANNGTASSIRDIFISDPIVVTYNANGGDDVAAANYTGTALTLPSATKGTDSFLGWFDAADGDNKIGEAGAPYTPGANVELFAHWEAVSSDARLASITFSSDAGTLVPAWNMELTEYTYTMPYGTTAIPTVIAATANFTHDDYWYIESAATAWGETTIVRGKAVSGDTKAYNIKMEIAPKDGVCLIKGNVGNNTFVIDEEASLLSGTPSKSNVKSESSTYETLTGWKFNSRPAHLGLTLSEGTFQAGDVVEVFVTSEANGGGTTHKMRVFDAADATPAHVLAESAADMVQGANRLVLPATSTSSLYLHRGASGADYENWNPYVAYFAVYRPMNPMLTAMTIDGRTVTINEDAKTATVTIPYEADLAALNVEPTIVWNAPAAENSIVVNDGSAWILGDNTYKLTDKDNDYTEYTITLTRDVLKRTVTFNAQGGSAVASELVVDGEKLAAAPADPTREDYLFLGWAETAAGEVVDVTDFVINADKEFYAQWQDEHPIKLIIDGTGNTKVLNSEKFYTGATMASGTVIVDEVTYKYATLSNTATTPVQNEKTKLIAYNATTTKTKLMVDVYNSSTSDRQVNIFAAREGSGEYETLATLALNNSDKKHVKTLYYEFNSNANEARTFYISVSSSASSVYFLQVKVIESGEPLKKAGEVGYSLNMNKGRMFDDDETIEGVTFDLSSAYKALDGGYVKITSSSTISFDITNPVTLSVETGNNKTYYVTRGAAGDANETALTGVSEFQLTEGKWFISGGSNEVQLKSIAFSAAKPVYTRENLNPANIGTLCVKYNGRLEGATLYELNGKNEYNKLVFDEVENNVMVAGRPYIFVPENGNTKIEVYKSNEEFAEDAGLYHGMQGTFVALSTITDGMNSPLWGNYIISNNKYIYVDAENCSLKENRAYILSLDQVPDETPAEPNTNGSPRRRVVMGGNPAPSVVTGFDNLNEAEAPMKVMIDGQMFIIRGEKMFDATGRLVK